MKTCDIIRILVEKNIQPSFHRMQILQYMVKNRIHPTVEDIYRNLSREIPTLSKTTVYNTLKRLAEKGVVSVVTVEGNELRYDYIESPHMHFKCTECGTIYDVFPETDIFNKSSVDGHHVCEYHLNLKGTCRQCIKSGLP